jgi:hypothetical protein
VAKFSTFSFGNGTHFGVTAVAIPPIPATAPTSWRIHVMWSGASWSGYNEAINCIGLRIRRGRQSYIAYGATSLAPMPPGTLTLTLNNHSGRYDAYAHSYIKPGRKIMVEEKYNTTGVRKTLFVGQITNISAPSYPDKTVTIEAVDCLKKAQEHKFTSPLPPIYYTTIDGAIAYFLDAVGIPHNLQSCSQSIGIFDPTGPMDAVINPVGPQDPTASKQANGQSVLEDLANASLGTIFADRTGKVRFYPIDYSGMSSHDIDQADCEKEIIPRQPWETTRNQIRMDVTLRGKEPFAPIWVQNTPLACPGVSYTSVDISYPASADIMTTLRPLTDYCAYLTATPSPADVNYATALVIVLQNVTSTRATVYIYNSNVNTMYLKPTIVRGCKFKETTSSVTVSDATSITDNDSIRDLQLRSPWLQDQGYANAYAALLLAFLKDPQKNPVLQIKGHPDYQYDYELMDHVHWTSTKLGADDTYSIGGMDIEWISENGVCNGQSVRTTLYLQKVLYSATPITGTPYYPGLEQTPVDNSALGTGSNEGWDVTFDMGDGVSIDTGKGPMYRAPFKSKIIYGETYSDGTVTMFVYKSSISNQLQNLMGTLTIPVGWHTIYFYGWTSLDLADGDWILCTITGTAYATKAGIYLRADPA